MKRQVIITIEVDPTEYVGAEDTEQGAIDLAIDMLCDGTDFPAYASIRCGGTERHTGDERD